MTSATDGTSRRRTARWALVAAWLVAACGESGTEPREGMVAVVEPFAGANQWARVGEPLREPVVVRLLDAGGSPVAGASVTFVPAEGHGATDPWAARSDSTGLASTRWTLGDSGGEQVLAATVRDGVSTEVRATALAGLPDLTASLSPGGAATWAGGSFEYVATVRNRGDTTAAATRARTFVSADNVITTSDEVVGAPSPVPVLGPGESASRTGSFTVSPAAELGTILYVGECVDPVEWEADTGDNCSESIRVTVTGRPDLSVAVSGDSVAVPAGGSVEFEIEVRNVGEDAGPATATTVATYVSPDSVIEATDERVGEPREVEALARGGSARLAAEYAADSASALWSVSWVGACVEAVEGERETGNNCSRAMKVTTVPRVGWSFVSSDGAETSAGMGDPRTVVKIAIDKYEPGPAGAAGWLPLEADDPQTVANVLRMLEVKTVGNKDDSGWDLAARRWGGTDSCGPICDEQVSVVATDSQTVVEFRPPGVQSAWVNPFYEAVGLEPPAWHPLYQAGEYALSFGGLSSSVLSIDADESLACRADHERGLQYDIVDGDMLVRRGEPGDASRDRRRVLDKKADPNRTYMIDVGFLVDKEYWRGGWSEWIPEGVRHATDIFQRSGVNVELRVSAIVRYQDYKYYANCQLDTLWKSNQYSWQNSREDIQFAMIEHYGIDLHYSLFGLAQNSGFCGFAVIRKSGRSFDYAKLFNRYGMVDPNCSDTRSPETSLESRFVRHTFLTALAHEIGHNLGLFHPPTKYYDNHGTFHPSGYGYVGEVAVTGVTKVTYGTLMAARISRIPFFSSDKALPKEEICNGDRTRYDYILDVGLCPMFGHRLLDDTIRLGGKVHFDGGTIVIDASEAMQYTIEDASKYACRPGSCQ